MSVIEVENLRKTFRSGDDEVVAVEDLTFSIEEGELFTLLGPSGCGKTTTLRCIAGLETIDGGEIRLDGEIVSSPEKTVFPENRDIGLMYQSYALWPHKTVRGNIMYALQGRDYPKEKQEERVEQLLEMVNMPEVIDRYPSELSGGQQQRVAFVRALSYEPKVLLMDEPLSNLDFKQRREMRTRLLEILDEVGITTLYVTHDQEEAFEISDEIVVMNQGRMRQSGRPEALYNDPNSTFVAQFLGEANIFEAVLDRRESDGTAVCQLPASKSGIEVRAYYPEDVIKDEENIALVVRPENMSIAAVEDVDMEVASMADVRAGQDEGITVPSIANGSNATGESATPENTYRGRVDFSLYRGNFTQNIVDIDGLNFKVKTDRNMFEEGDHVVVNIHHESARVINNWSTGSSSTA